MEGHGARDRLVQGTGFLLALLSLHSSLAAQDLLTELRADRRSYELAKFSARAGMNRQETGLAIHAGLKWLVQHQAADGSWPEPPDAAVSRPRARGSHPQTRATTRPTTARWRGNVSTTGWAILAFLAAGQTREQGEHSKAFSRATGWLLKRQDQNGAFETRGPMPTLEHAVATWALAETCAVGWDQELEKPVRLALRYLSQKQLADGGWSVGPKVHRSQILTTCFATTAFAMARESEIAVHPQILKRTTAWIESVTGDDGKIRKAAATDSHSTYPTETAAAAGLWIRRCLDQDIRKSKKTRAALEILFSNPPLQGERRDAVDPLHWHVGALACYQGRSKYLSMWRHRMRRALLKTKQRIEEAGCWDRVANNIYLSNRASTTAHTVLALCIRWRYAPIR